MGKKGQIMSKFVKYFFLVLNIWSIPGNDIINLLLKSLVAEDRQKERRREREGEREKERE